MKTPKHVIGNRIAEGREYPYWPEAKPQDCKHNWTEEYYGLRCSLCNLFCAYEAMPWSFDPGEADPHAHYWCHTCKREVSVNHDGHESPAVEALEDYEEEI